MNKIWFSLVTLCLLLASQGAYAEPNDNETWPDDIVIIANEIKSITGSSHQEQISTYKENIKNLTGHEKLSAMMFALQEMFAQADPRFFKEQEIFAEEIKKQNASRFILYSEIFETAEFEPSKETLRKLEQKLLDYEQRESLDIGQRIFIATRLINLYLYTGEDHKSLTAVDNIESLIKQNPTGYAIEKQIFSKFKQHLFNSLHDKQGFVDATKELINSKKEHNIPLASESFLHNGTILLMQEKHYQKAIEVNVIARELTENFSDESAKFSPAILCMGLSNRTENYRKAEQCIQEAEPFLDDWYFLAATFKLQAARTYTHLNQLGKARSYLNSITEKDLTFVRPEVALSKSEVEALIYHAEGKAERAFEKYQHYNQEVTKYYDQKISQTTKDLHEASLKEKQALYQVNTALQNETLIQQSSVKRIRRYLNIVILAAILTFCLFLLLAYQYFMKQRLSAELQGANTSLSELLHERDLMLQEIHHRIKNNLQLIISLLNLQGRRVQQDNEKKKQSHKGGRRVIREIQGRVHTMSLIHKELYQSDNYDSVNVSELITNLTSYIFSLFSEKTHLTLELDDLTLDFDKALPVGLITCEIISNSLEHGRSKDSESEITVKLKHHGDRVSLKFWDNGPGFEDFKFTNDSSSLGFLLVKDLAEQVGGELSYYDCPETGGACYDVQIPMEEKNRH